MHLNSECTLNQDFRKILVAETNTVRHVDAFHEWKDEIGIGMG